MCSTTFKIGWLFPDTLYLHGDRGNILALERGLKLSGYGSTVDKIDFDTVDFDPMAYDFLFCSPGEISAFSAVITWLTPYKDALEAYITAGRPLLTTGTSVCLWGREIVRSDGTVLKGLGLLDSTAKENTAVYGDDIWYHCHFAGQEMKLMGSQIQMHDLSLGNEKPFGTLYYGYGNTGKSRDEGILRHNAVFTHTLGPILVLNPWLTAAFIGVMAGNKGLEQSTPSFDMDLEKRSYETKKAFIGQKETHLTTTWIDEA